LARTHSQQVFSSRLRFANGLRNNSVGNAKMARDQSNDMPNTQIMKANLKNDAINPFRNLNSREIEKINKRFV
jgi:hypothetical protein